MQSIIEKYYQHVGNNVYQFRSTQRLTQDQLAEKSKVTGAYISQIERADLHKGITCTAIFQIARALTIPPCILLAEVPCQKYAECISQFAVNLPLSKRARHKKAEDG